MSSIPVFGSGPGRRVVVSAAVTLLVLGFLLGGATAQQHPTGGQATMYVGTYDHAITVIDEATMAVVDRIETTAGIPRNLQLTLDRQRLYSTSADFEYIEIFDVASRESIDAHSLSHDNSKVRIWRVAIHPSEEYLILHTSTDTKLIDRFEIGPPVLQQYNLETREVMRDIPWPGGVEREFSQMMFSPDGDLLYIMTEEVTILETESFEEVDTWEISRPMEEGMGALNFGISPNIYDEPGFFTGLFRTTDPINGRRLMGVARVNLPDKSVDYYTLGPSMGVSFSLAPDGKKAYGLFKSIGHYEFWTFDLEGRRVESRQTFEGRPRMSVMPSSNGELLYVFNAGNTVDVYSAADYSYLHTLALDGDTTTTLIVVPATDSGRP